MSPESELPPPAAAQPAWKQQRERSALALVRLIVWIATHLGRRVSRLLLWPIALYFLLSSPVVRASAREFLRRVLPHAVGWRDLYRVIFFIASTALDRVFLLTGRFGLFDIKLVDGRGNLWHPRSGKGAILITAHLGSFDILRVLGREHSRLDVKVVMDRAQGRMITETMGSLNPHLAEEIIDAAEGPALVLRLKEALARGCVVGLMADRVTATDPGFEVEFLGGPVRLPGNPWKLAAALGYPVVLCFGLYEGGNRYTLHFEEFAPAEQVPRSERAAHARAAAQRFAARLEFYARLAPYNWFNFFDFWPDDPARHH